MGDGALGSDHINYLILRYLQEAGHENAAKALHQDWHRPDEYHDPEKLPFASQVKQFELVNIIQDGLFHDRLQAHVTKQSPRFNLIPSTSDPLSLSVSNRRASITSDTRRDARTDVKTSVSSHHQHHHRQRSDVAASASAASNDFPLPPPKRVKKSSADEPSVPAAPPQTNGDAMDVDPKTPATTADDGELPSEDGLPTDTATDRGTSEAVDIATNSASSPPLPPATETISAATQTDESLRAKRSETIYWSVEKEGANIVHALWNPQPDTTAHLLAAGDALCRFYNVPSSSEQPASSTTNGDNTLSDTTHHFDVEDMPPGSITTAACWHPSGRYATCSVELLRQINGSQHVVRCLFDTETQKARGAKRIYSDNAYIQLLQRQSPTVNMALRYNRPGSLLLSVSTSVKRGLVDIWQGPAEEPIAMKLFAKQILDAVWATDDEIIVSGEQCLEAYRLKFTDATDSVMADGDSSPSIGTRNLTKLHSWTTDKTWGKVRYDSHNRVLAATAINDDAIVLLRRSPSDDGWTPLPGFPAAGDPSIQQISAMAFEHAPPIKDEDANGDFDAGAAVPRRLATTHHTGAVNIYAVTHDSCTPLHTLHLGTPHLPEAALALSWSPDGQHLAVASEETIKVWNLSVSPKFPVLNWRASPQHWTQTDPDDVDESMDMMQDDDHGAPVQGEVNLDDSNNNNNNNNNINRRQQGVDGDVDVQAVHEPSLSWDAEGKSLLFAVGRKVAVIRLLPPA
ncbi:hypothetical protein AAFC00_006491 [Neodothiora populina]|uniref:LisH domain-containing protein n=1 Tax=Neodothiora populina TaxID=2781224 RepID=A0ABR3P6P6_9PEZI